MGRAKKTLRKIRVYAEVNIGQRLEMTDAERKSLCWGKVPKRLGVRLEAAIHERLGCVENRNDGKNANRDVLIGAEAMTLSGHELPVAYIVS